ncbi:NAD-dependent succinate-semialdehyde dehydrogenase [Sinorhizobium medicae]|uniref:NAD-dependent succinate-semialdehyde dehydrogenase n=1 Tax=Sinorhizobium medicae TaxID=110321 RepID=UPI000FD95C6A|nr:NAD-dependent succinate-semialdehyde dehydrogenase [Sinorhizobium medicae]MDW9500523.1 aldehyde dehydrogenase family protein [Sinorhizobium meliloti]RVH85870.1 NAD-dependent succinate-semialdehyde dehydrogenase [Sinorhizobium medicae]RVP59988.1 NAD-dependent succinate-semialdehyde dehydrogenase [Sinorhizobium medicae]
MKLETWNPAIGELVEAYPSHDEAAIEARVELSHKTAKSWARVSMQERAAILLRLADLLDQRAEEYGRLITLEMGKPIAEAVAEVKKSAMGARHFAEKGPDYLAEQPIEGLNARVVYEPLGPIFAIMPWNLPFWQVLRFFIPTALAGNTVLVKHSDSVQGCAQALEQLILDAGAPEGLYQNLAVRRGAVAAIVADHRIAAATVTGSTEAGRAVARVAGEYGKKVVLELGGSDPFIVFADADFEKAVNTAVLSRFANNAQSCIAAKRILVETGIYDAFERAFVEAVKALRIGDPLDPETKLGPLARPSLVADTERQVTAAVKQGGRLLCGGKRLDRAGNYFAPAVISGLSHGAPIVREEIFGPVAMLFRFESEAEAIAMANASEFGLGATVWTKDEERIRRIVSELETGAVFINSFVRSDPRAPFGGVKASGFGRELGALGTRELTNAKLVFCE